MTGPMTEWDRDREALRAALEAAQAASQRAIDADLKAGKERAKAADAAEKVDAIAKARQDAWATRVVGTYPAESAAADARHDEAWQAFQDAAGAGGNTLAAYIDWVSAGVERNRLFTRRMLAGGSGTGHAPPFNRLPPYEEVLAAAVAAAVYKLYGGSEQDALEEASAARQGIRPDDDGLQHAEACPGDRIETFEAERIGKTITRVRTIRLNPFQSGVDETSSRPHTPVTVTRCLWCGAELVTDQDLDRQEIEP